MEDWKIQRDRTGCEQPGCPLPGSSHYFAVLEFPECMRREMCDACFTERQGRAEKEQQPLVFWRAARKQNDSKEPVLDLVSLRALFDRLADVEDERARALRYFCALLLLRKRVLKMTRPRTKEQERADLVLNRSAGTTAVRAAGGPLFEPGHGPTIEAALADLATHINPNCCAPKGP